MENRFRKIELELELETEINSYKNSIYFFIQKIEFSLINKVK